MITDQPYLQFNKETLNNKGELLAVVSLHDNGKLLFEDHLNLTKDTERQKLINKLINDFNMDDAEERVLENIQIIRSELEAVQLRCFWSYCGGLQ